MNIKPSTRPITLALLIFASLTLGACTDAGQSENPDVSFRFDWFTSVSFCGEVWGMQEYAEKNDLDLTLNPGSGTTEPIKLVVSDSDDFGAISAVKFLEAVDKGANIVAIGMINQLSPTVFLSKKKTGIETPQDWVDKKVGILPGGATEHVYRSLLKEVGISSSQLTEVTVPFGIDTFVAGEYDVRPAFIYDEPVSLEMKNIEYNMIEPKKYGINYVGRVYFTTEKMVKENPDVVQKFIDTMGKGWRSALKSPPVAAKRLKKFDSETDSTRVVTSLQKATNYFRPKGDSLLTFDLDNWDQTVNELERLDVTQVPDYRSYIDRRFVRRFYEKKSN